MSGTLTTATSISFLLVAYITILFASTISIFFQKKFEHSLPVSILLITTILYVCGFFTGHLKVGVYFIYVLCVFAMLFLIANVCGIFQLSYQKKLSLKARLQGLSALIITPGFFFWLILLLWIYLINMGRLVSLWDELSHWALAVKNMCYFDKFAFIEAANTTYKDYPPMISLWEYFLCQMTGYCDQSFYMSFGIFVMAFILPCCDSPLSFKSKVKAYLVSFGRLLLFIIVPLAVANTYMVVGYADILLGFVCFYLLRILYSNLTANETTILNSLDRAFIFTSLGLGTFNLALIKNTGILFVLVLTVFALVSKLEFVSVSIRKTSGKKNANKIVTSSSSDTASKHLSFSTLIALVTLSAGLTGLLSWKLLLLINHVPRVWTVNKEHIAIGELIPIYLKKIFLNGYGIGPIKLSPILILIALSAISYITIYLSDLSTETKLLYRKYVGLFDIFSLVYLLGLFFVYALAFTPREAIVLNSFKRYFFCFLVIFIFFVLDLLLYHFQKKKEYYMLPILLAFSFLFVPFEQISLITYDVTSDWAEAFDYNVKLSTIEYHADKFNPEEDKLLVISETDNGQVYYTIKYKLAPLKVCPHWSFGSPSESMSEFAYDITYDEFLEYLQEEHVTYVYVYHCDDYFNTNYGACFPSGIAQDKTLYKVNTNGELPGELSLELAY